jgi:type VI secretion system protein ImpM
MDVGLYGKLPTHGDFLRRRVAEEFVAVWDPWLQGCLADSRAVLGERWLDIYLTSPVWRFALGPRVCGAAPAAGLLVPSVDRVGRYFPLTVVWPTPAGRSSLEVAIGFQAGFERAERLVLDTLAQDQIEFADFDRRVQELAPYLEAPDPDEGLRLTRDAANALASPGMPPRCIPLRAAAQLRGPALQMFGCQLETGAPLALWWTDGSRAVAPSWLITRGLPDFAHFSAMLDGAWEHAGWDVAAVEPDHAATELRPPSAEFSLQITSAALSDPGPVRASNQDAFLERADLGLWAVADGMGGLRDGEAASRMVCDSLADVPRLATLDEQIEAASSQLHAVNAYLRRAATRAFNPVQSGSTVIVLMIRDTECAMLWAGDSRAYRLRDGLLSQLTQDHAAASQEGADAEAITRAVGTEDELRPDILRGDVRPADRFLLCSDGICRTLDVGTLRHVLQNHAPAACCAQLIARSKTAGGTDNMTAVVIDCAASEWAGA